METERQGRVWTFKLRENVKFHDGQPFTAKDVVATFDRLADPGKRLGGALGIKGVLSKGGAKAVDDHTVAFHLDAPNGNFPYYVSSDNYNAVILPANYAGGYEKSFIGTGPFRLENIRAKVGASFVRNPDYWGEKALPQRVQFSFYADQQAQLLALQGHQADVMGTFTVQGGAAILNNPDYKAVGVKSSAHRQIHMRNDNPLFKDKRVRQALALSLDRDVLVRGLFKGRAQLGNDSPFAPVFPSSDAGVPQRRIDVAKAQAVARASGRAQRLRRHADHRKVHGDSRSRGRRAERGEGDRRAHQSESREPVAVLRRGHAGQIGLARLAARHHRLRSSRRAERVPECAAHERRHVECRALSESAIRSTGRAIRRGASTSHRRRKSPGGSRPCCSTKRRSSFRSFYDHLIAMRGRERRALHRARAALLRPRGAGAWRPACKRATRAARLCTGRSVHYVDHSKSSPPAPKNKKPASGNARARRRFLATRVGLLADHAVAAGR